MKKDDHFTCCPHNNMEKIETQMSKGPLTSLKTHIWQSFDKEKKKESNDSECNLWLVY